MTDLSRLHPLPLFGYFLFQILLTAFSGHPFVTGASLLSGILLALLLRSARALRKRSGWLFFLFFAITLTNPLFSHNGATPLFYLNSNAITLEALLYGAHLGAQVAAVLIWCDLYSHLFTSDKSTYLLSAAAPKLALVFSMTLRLVPRYRREQQKMKEVQGALGLFSSQSWLDRLRAHFQLFSAVIAVSLETSIETGNAMTARGYGLKPRGRYSLFAPRGADAFFGGFTLLLAGVSLAGQISGSFQYSFYPVLHAYSGGAYFWLFLAAYGVFSLLPSFYIIQERIRWTVYRSGI